LKATTPVSQGRNPLGVGHLAGLHLCVELRKTVAHKRLVLLMTTHSQGLAPFLRMQPHHTGKAAAAAVAVVVTQQTLQSLHYFVEIGMCEVLFNRSFDKEKSWCFASTCKLALLSMWHSTTTAI
jgi:hypothetical protein